MTFGGRPTVLRLRQKQAAPNGRFGLLAGAALAFFCLGFVAYWWRTGSWTIEAGTISNLGALVWFGPLLIGFTTTLLIGDRGPFRAFYHPRTTLTVSADGLGWWTAKGGAQRLAWSELGGVSRFTNKSTTTETVFDVSGREIVTLEGPFAIEGSRRAVSLPAVILDARPREFFALDPNHPERGCLTRSPRGPDLAGSGEAPP
jgi:hypothetical protein